MGLTGRAYIFWTTVLLTLVQALLTISSIKDANPQSTQPQEQDLAPTATIQTILPTHNNPSSRMTIAVDANLFAYKFAARKNSLTPNSAVFQVAKILLEKLVNVHLVVDHPTDWHPSKRATCEQISTKEKDKIRASIHCDFFC